MRNGRKLDLAIGVFLLLLPLLWFAPQALGNKTLLPADNLYSSAPWSSYAAQMGAQVPYNPLISDLILENYPWKSFLNEAVHSGQLPLWNSRVFAGVPFLAAGQHSALYPLTILFYVLPIWRAYGVFTWLQLGLAALGVYIFARVLHLRRPAAILAAIAYAFSGFFIVSVNFTMMIAAAAWLPYILTVIELMIRAVERTSGGTDANKDHPAGTSKSFVQGPGATGRTRGAPLAVLASLGAVLLAVQILAGHIEITYYVLMVSAFYAAWRLVAVWRCLSEGGWRLRQPRTFARLVGWLIGMIVLGMALGGVQLLPLVELVQESFREGSASLSQVRGWAWPSRQIITFLLPDFFGNPTHHSIFDIWTRTWVPVTQNVLGQPINNTEWGIKNYVEGGNYLGIATLLLALVAVAGYVWLGLRARARRRTTPHAGPLTLGLQPAGTHVALFGILAILSLLFAFGTPLYAVLFYLLPGYKQLHSAFRWVFPYTLSMAVLAGYGMNWLILAAEGKLPEDVRQTISRIARILALTAILAGILALAAVALSLVVPDPFVRIGQWILDTSEKARENAFANARMVWSYEAMGIARFGTMALGAGLVLLWGARGQRKANSQTAQRSAARSWSIAAIALLTADLWLFGHGFNPATDPKLLTFKPPVIEWLQNHQDSSQPWRFTSYERPGDQKILLANAGMMYGLEDVRGYDSIIPRQYVEYMQRHQTQSELLYNRIAPTYAPKDGQSSAASLDDHLLDLLGVRYVLSTREIQNPAYRLVYDQEIKVYENTRAMPRAFLVGEAVAAADQKSALDRTQAIDPRQSVVVEGYAGTLPAAGSPQLAEARISQRSLKETFVDVNISDPGWLVLTDNFFPGWKAYVRPFGSQGEGMDANGEAVEEQVPIYRADGTFRAIYLDKPGQWTVRFVYSPRSLMTGGYCTFLAAITMFLIVGAWAWGRFYRGEGSEVATVAKNSVVQMFMSVLNKGIDFAFAMLRLRILNPAGEGSYTFAINFYMIFDIIIRFGLGTLLTRDVAADRSQARRYLTNVVGLRVVLWLLSLPVMLLIGMYYQQRGRLTPEEAQAIAIFAGALLFSNIADAITSVFNAYEKMEYPAGLATATTVVKVGLGGLVLLPPFNMGFVGLAWVSLITNILQVVWLYAVMERSVLPHRDRQPRRGLEFGLQRQMMGESLPLMLNHLLQTIFWRLGVWILYDFTGAIAVGIFSAGSKYLDGVGVIPAYFTLAIFPLMSRHARNGTDGVAKAYRLAVQLLLIVALPIAVFVSFAATPMIRILGGGAYLPNSAIALSVMIWSIPIGFINSVTQYTLIAVGQQRFLTRAFVIAVACTAAANLLLVSRFGYLAAAIALIPAEASLFIPFAWAVRRYVAPVSWLGLCGVPILATLVNAGLVAGLLRLGLPLLVALAAGDVAYLLVLGLFGTFRNPDFALLWNQFGIRLPWHKLQPEQS